MKPIRSGAIAFALLLAFAAAPSAQTPSTPAAPSTDTVPRKSISDLKQLMATGEVTIVDVRPPWSYRAGHIPGAILLQLNEVSKSLDMLKAAKKPIITYCACSKEHSAAVVAETLRKAGIEEVYALLGGWSSWLSEKNPVVEGEKPK